MYYHPQMAPDCMINFVQIFKRLNRLKNQAIKNRPLLFNNLQYNSVDTLNSFNTRKDRMKVKEAQVSLCLHSIIF
jgi:hypothetical protein